MGSCTSTSETQAAAARRWPAPAAPPVVLSATVVAVLPDTPRHSDKWSDDDDDDDEPSGSDDDGGDSDSDSDSSAEGAAIDFGLGVPFSSLEDAKAAWESWVSEERSFSDRLRARMAEPTRPKVVRGRVSPSRSAAAAQLRSMEPAGLPQSDGGAGGGSSTATAMEEQFRVYQAKTSPRPSQSAPALGSATRTVPPRVVVVAAP